MQQTTVFPKSTPELLGAAATTLLYELLQQPEAKNFLDCTFAPLDSSSLPFRVLIFRPGLDPFETLERLKNDSRGLSEDPK